MKPIVVIVGRPNVGKSTLFNRIVGKRISIVEPRPGVTRDRIYADASWLGHTFTLVDTGGIETRSEDEIIQGIRYQANQAIQSADVIIFLVDGREGLTPADEEVAQILRQSKKPVVLACNKIEKREKMPPEVYEFYSLGLGDPIDISAELGYRIGDLLDEVVKYFPEVEEEEFEDYTKVAVIGRPNVGKSSIVNAILGEERVIVSSIPGTTRDAIDTPFEKDGKKYVFIDTAGMRRKSRVKESVEYYSVLRSLKAIERSDVVLMVIDATQGVAEQDKKIFGYAYEAGKASIIVVNKWDLIDKDHRTMEVFREKIRNELLFLQYAPIIFISAKTKKRLINVLELIDYVMDQYTMRIKTRLLNEVIEDAMVVAEPPTVKGKKLKIYYATQKGVKPPSFILFVNDPQLMHFSYKRYLENQLRETFGLEGTPIKLITKKRK